jgi:hypothetical protein
MNDIALGVAIAVAVFGHPPALLLLLGGRRQAFVLALTAWTSFVVFAGTMPVGQAARFALEHPHVARCGNPIVIPFLWAWGMLALFAGMGAGNLAIPGAKRTGLVILLVGVPIAVAAGFAGYWWGRTH